MTIYVLHKLLYVLSVVFSDIKLEIWVVVNLVLMPKGNDKFNWIHFSWLPSFYPVVLFSNIGSTSLVWMLKCKFIIILRFSYFLEKILTLVKVILLIFWCSRMAISNFTFFCQYFDKDLFRFVVKYSKKLNCSYST